MAQRRMFSLKVVDTDAFCEMPSSAQNLYFHIGMRADDEGFYAGVKGLMAKIHASIDDLNVLLARHYILDRGDGVYVVKHWKMNNYLQSDRIKPTEYEEKRAGLYVKKDGSYTLDPGKSAVPVPHRKTVDTECIQNVSIEEISTDKFSLDSEERRKEEEKNQIRPIYTEEIVRRSGIAAAECLRMKKAKQEGKPISPEWELTLKACAEALKEWEDDEPF